MAINPSDKCERSWRDRPGCTKFVNCFDSDKTDHETWFDENYLPSLRLINKFIKSRDFEGMIRDDARDVALFEVKLITLPEYQKEVDEELKVAPARGDEDLQPSPKWKEIKSNVANHIRKAVDQLLKKLPEKDIPRIIFLILNTPDVKVSEIEDAITGGVIGQISNGKLVCTYQSRISDNKEAIDLFSDEEISGLIAIKLCGSHSYHSFIFRNSKAKFPIPPIFESNVERDVEL